MPLEFKKLVSYVFRETSDEENIQIEKILNDPKGGRYLLILDNVLNELEGMNFQDSESYCEWSKKDAELKLSGQSHIQNGLEDNLKNRIITNSKIQKN